MKKRFFVLIIIVIGFMIIDNLYACEADNVLSIEASYGGDEESARCSMTWDHLESFWISRVVLDTDNNFIVALGPRWEFEILNFETCKCFEADFNIPLSVLFDKNGLKEEYLGLSPHLDLRFDNKFLFESWHDCQFSDENFGIWETNNKFLFIPGIPHEIGAFLLTLHNGNQFSFSYYGAIYRHRFSPLVKAEVLLGMNPEKEKKAKFLFSFSW